MNDIDEVVLPDTSATGAPTDAAGEIAELAHEVRALKDLFTRRLLDDKQKGQAFNELYSQLQFARDGLVKTTLTPIVNELILIVDRIDAAEAVDEMTASVRDEMLEVLARRGVTPVAAGDGKFDPSLHEAVGMVQSDAEPGTIISIERSGYRSGETLIRPTQVTIAKT